LVVILAADDHYAPALNKKIEAAKAETEIWMI